MTSFVLGMVMGLCGCALSHFMNCFLDIFILSRRSSIFLLSAGVISPLDSRILAISRSALPGVPGPLSVLEPRPPAVAVAARAAAALAAWISWALAAILERWPACRTVGGVINEDVVAAFVEETVFAAMRRHIMGDDAAAVE